MSRKTTVFAPHDRMNYGDFLFAIMLDYALSKKTGRIETFKKHSIITADFTDIGAYKTRSYKHLIAEVNASKIDHIVVGGGQSLGANWMTLFSYIRPLVFFMTFRLRLYKLKFYEPLLMKYLGAKSNFPYNINKKDFRNANLKVLYNSVGSGFLTQEGYQRLQQADYIAVRDRRSYDTLKDKVPHIRLVPDSAIILSDVYPKEGWVPEQKNYIFFQLSLHKFGGALQPIVLQLRKILDETPHAIVLCPIGTAPGHEDDIILQKIYRILNDDRISFVKHPTLPQIAGLIAHSVCYIGTSLHGIITAMSYGIPYIGLNETQKKLISYNDTWGIPVLKDILPPHSFFPQLEKILQANAHGTLTAEILKHTEQQKMAYYESFDRIFEIIST